MKQRLITLLDRPIVRYLVVGGSVYVLELGVIFTAQELGASAVWAVALAFWIGLVISFGLQKIVTFRDRRSQRGIVLRQFIAVTALVLWNFGFTIAVTKLLEGHIDAAIARTLALLITTIWNFTLYKTSIFRQPENPIY